MPWEAIAVLPSSRQGFVLPESDQVDLERNGEARFANTPGMLLVSVRCSQVKGDIEHASLERSVRNPVSC